MLKRLILTLALLFACLPSASAAVYTGAPPDSWAEKDVLEWTIFDVDEGDAMLITCGGESMLVDGGPEPFRGELRDALSERGLTHLRYVFSTHSHDDHIDGLYHLFRYGFTTDKYLHGHTDGDLENDLRAYRTARAAKDNGASLRVVRHGDTLMLGEAKLTFLRCTEYENVNARSIVLRVDYREASILLCADIIGLTQHFFAETIPEQLDADLIKLPHHAITATVSEFLDAVSPEACIATNRKQDLDPRSVQQLDALGVPAFYSGNGAVHAVTDGQDWYLWQLDSHAAE